jgi:glucose-1-phosphate cytidylyltransferase
MKVVILAGGLGSRLAEKTRIVPKPMVRIGGKPIIWHIMKHYHRYGNSEFVIALGYKGSVIRRYFTGGEYDWTTRTVDTKLKTNTGGRLKRLEKYLKKDTFLMTYGDGVSDVDLEGLLNFHRTHGHLATVTAVRPPSRFGGLTLNGTKVLQFTEKPQGTEGWINGGFFVLEPKVLDYIRGDETSFEYDTLEQLARIGKLGAYRHEGFWQCMDTLREVKYLQKLWKERQAPWKVWL